MDNRMTPEVFERAAALFLEYRGGSAEVQQRILQGAEAESAIIAAELRRMVAHDPQGSSFLENPLARVPLGELFPEGERGGDRWELPQPVRVGEYAVTRLLGAGGMGVVYEALQQQPARTVALKVIHLALATPALRRRFVHESEVLARLAHPGIAHIYEAGVGRMEYADGASVEVPFFAMEFIAGQPLTEYARARELTLSERLVLAARVCDAVQHAHAKGVIHRDLKPSNILVPDSGEPKVLDFGVARSLDADLPGATLHTLAGQIVGTVPYTSPEQLAGASSAVDTRCDIYSLGVVLYELLSGRLPYDLRQLSLAAAVRMVQQQEPARLGSIDRHLRGDVETIVHKCLEKHVERRYASAGDLAADLRRFLANEPILARPQTAFYQLRKFARRRRPLFAGMVVALVALLAGAGAALWQGARAVRAGEHAKRMALLSEEKAKEAESARKEAEAALTFLTDMLRSADPGEQGKDVRVVDVLAKLEESVPQHWTDEPLVEARVRWAAGVTYLGLGDYAAAVPHLERTCALRREVLGEADPQTIDAELYLAQAYEKLKRTEDARILLERAWEDHGAGSVADALTVRLMSDRAVVLRDLEQPEEAGELFAAAATLAVAVLGPDAAVTHGAQQSLAIHLDQMGRSAEAGPLFEQVLATRRRLYGEPHPLTLETTANYAMWCQRAGRFEESAELLSAVLEHEQAVLGSNHPNTLQTMNALLVTYRQLERYDEAEAIGRQLLTAATEVFGPADFRTLITRRNVASILSISGHLPEAETMLNELLEVQSQSLGADSLEVAATRDPLGQVILAQGRREEAVEKIAEALRAFSAALPADHPQVTAGHRHHAEALMALEHYADAEAELAEMLAPLQQARGGNHPEVLTILHDLAACADAQGHADDAARYRAMLEAATAPPAAG